MNTYQPQPDRCLAVISTALSLPSRYAHLPALADSADPALFEQVLNEAGKFVGQVIAPLQSVGDQIGAQWNDGQVTTPPGFAGAYQQFWQAGWPALASAVDDGGQGLPSVLEAVLYEWLSAANHGWTMAPGLLHGAYECIKHHASAELKARYLEKVATGEWLATMCLTEAHAGSDLGLARTKAELLPDGSYRISGTKIFISGGDHDLTENIVHLVLARLPDSPPGPKGLSLFLAPKWLPDGQRNAIVCERIEEKMGLHGSPTCVMRFDEGTGWIIGEAGKGLNAMFVMMNAARLHVALQGIGLLDAAWQKANAYAHERRQMRAPVGRDPAQAADLIVLHPAVQRLLGTQRAWIDGGRLLAYQTAFALDTIKHHPDAEQRLAAQQWCAVVTPVLKAACTHQAFYGASECLQVLGGHGYVKEWGIEQIVRDARVAMIYEGTNEIQAIDLLFRKVLGDNGQALLAVCTRLGVQLEAVKVSAPARHRAAAQRALAGITELEQVVRQLCGHDKSRTHELYAVADDFLRLVALVLQAFAHAMLIQSQDQGFETGEQAFSTWIWPEMGMRRQMVGAPMAA